MNNRKEIQSKIGAIEEVYKTPFRLLGNLGKLFK